MDVIDRALAARDENGPIAVRVFCAQCPREQKALATVHESSYGLVYDAALPSAVDMGPMGETIKAQQKARAREVGQRLPFLGVVGGCTVLLEDEDPEQDEPAAECPTHGREAIPPQRLILAALRRESSAAGKILVHRAEE